MTSQVEVPPLTGLIHFNSGKRRVKTRIMSKPFVALSGTVTIIDAKY